MTSPQYEQASVAGGATETSPFLVEYYMVQAASFWGMAYRDNSGLWRNAFNHRELLGDVQVFA